MAVSHSEQGSGVLANLVFFIHIPKTAGTSFRVAAERRFNERVLRDYGRDFPDTSKEIIEHVYEDRDIEALARTIVEQRIGMICGHVGYQIYQGLVEPERVVVFLRDPIQRVISEFHHARRLGGYVGTLKEFARQGLQRNKQWQMVRGLNLGRTGLVGLSEYYSHSLRLLGKRMDLELPYLELNANPERRDNTPYQVSDEEADELRELNAEDVLLYRRAIEGFSAATGVVVETPTGLSEVGPARDGVAAEAPLTGAIDGLDRGRLSGWAMQPGVGRPVRLDVFFGDQLIQTVAAGRYRRDLDEKGIHPTGCAGFLVELGELTAGTVIRCRLHGTDKELRGSPRTV
ncbi:MAG: hypothetical protein ACREX3_17525 [Gammaproteobacteria bacterium]